MAELGSGEVYAPPRTIQAWKTILNWLSFFFQIFLQIIIKASPSKFSQLVSTTAFRPLPDVELSELTQEDAPPTAAVTVEEPGGRRDWPSEKLTVREVFTDLPLSRSLFLSRPLPLSLSPSLPFSFYLPLRVCVEF